MNTYYALMAVLSVLNLVVFLVKFQEKKLNYYILAAFVLMLVSNMGNFLIATADTLSVALIAKKINYVGGCFIPPVILLLIFKMCNIYIKKWLQNFLLLFSGLVFGMVLTIGYHGMYYKSAELVFEGETGVIIPEYGFGHVFFNILLYGYLLVGITVLIYSLKSKKQISHKNLWILTIIDIMAIVFFLIGRKLELKIEITPLVYAIDGWILLYLNRRVTVYNLEDNIISSLGKQEHYGYIMFDIRRNFLGANNIANRILPELKSCRIDKPITDCPDLEFLQKELDEYEKEEDTLFVLDRAEEHYEGHIRRIWYADKVVGYLFEIENATDRYKYTQLLSEYNEKLKDEVEEKISYIQNIQEKILFSMADIVENRDGNTGGHIKRTSHVIEILMDTIKEHHIFVLEERFCQAVIKAAPMHDLGKIAIDDKILRKPGRLTDEEFTIMQTHASKSEELVENILTDVEDSYFVMVAKNIARHHHEKWNGSGYPDHLEREDIPLEARIMAVADVYDALVSKRCYKESMSFEQANQVMLESMGSHFDPKLEEVFVKSRKKLEAYYMS